jgi:hypothetical protein
MSAESSPIRLIDHSGLRAHQAVLIGLLLGGFIAGQPGVIGFSAAAMILGTLRGAPAFLPAYVLLRKTGWLKPDLKPDRPEPHRFAHSLGTAFLILSTIAFLADWVIPGWLLAGLVALLAAVNLFLGFCLGCAMYYWLGRLGLQSTGPTSHRADQVSKPEGSRR